MSDTSQTQTIEQAFNKTDLGHMIYENRKLFIGIILAILVGATGLFSWRQVKSKNAHEVSLKVFEFQTGVWAQAKAGSIDTQKLLNEFNSLDVDAKSAPVILPLVLEMTKTLMDKDEAAGAHEIISQVGDLKSPVAAFFLHMQKAVIEEKVGKVNEAIVSLEKLAKMKDVLMPAKISVELGRLYLSQGEKGKAQTQLEYVLSTYPNDEAAKLAKLYLSQVNE